MMRRELEPVGTLRALDEAERFLVQDQLGNTLGAAIGRQPCSKRRSTLQRATQNASIRAGRKTAIKFAHTRSNKDQLANSLKTVLAQTDAE
jgi:hypothetical protein